MTEPFSLLETLSAAEQLSILTCIPQLGPIRIRHLMHRFANAQAILNTPAAQLQSSLISAKLAEAIAQWPILATWRHNLDLIQQQNVSLISYQDPLYPPSLQALPDAPVLLYMKGSLQKEDQQALALVGTRYNTVYGEELARKTSQELAQSGFTIISGLARGIDTAAHQGALQAGGRTVAVIGSGLNNIYPQENRQLAVQIAAQGALLSEFAMNTPPDRHNFPQRNRIVSGLALGVVLIEAPLNSGALLTMRLAQKHGKKLFSFPGRVDMETFRGNHALIKAGNACLVENSQEISQKFAAPPLFSPSLVKKSSLPPLEEEEKKLLLCMPNQEISLESLVLTTGLPVAKLNVLLMKLLLNKTVKEFPGKVFKKLVQL